jgi:hypothetical protein
MQQILYTSRNSAPVDEEEWYRILNQSRHNNAIDGVTGVLWTDGTRYIQVFEGPDASVLSTAIRIWNDPRHHDINVIHQIPIDQAEFFSWNGVLKNNKLSDKERNDRLRRLLVNASFAVSKRFLEFAR